MTERERHIIPDGDLIAHDTHRDCPCGPDAEPIHDGDGIRTGWLYVHHSLDGRETKERP